MTVRGRVARPEPPAMGVEPFWEFQTSKVKVHDGSRMKRPGIGVEIGKVVAFADNGQEVATGETEVEISGNQSGLLKLAEVIKSVAQSGKDGYHIHLMSNDEAPLLRTEDMWLTISLNSRK